MVDSCERCNIRHLCRSTTACPDLWHGAVTTGTIEDAPEQEPADDQENNVWVHLADNKHRRIIRDSRRFARITAPRRL